jgi:hypothetical protein
MSHQAMPNIRMSDIGKNRAIIQHNANTNLIGTALEAHYNNTAVHFNRGAHTHTQDRETCNATTTVKEKNK